MHYTGQVYRPPMESDTPLLEITTGCSHNRCAFCTMYNRTPFSASKLDDIKADLAELRNTLGSDVRRIYLLNGDPFALSANRLLKISDLVHAQFPNIETLTCYASINDLNNKSDYDLKELRAAGYNDLYMGLESGWGKAVKLMRKGFTIEEAWRHLDRLEKAGFRYAALLMIGAGGKGTSEINVAETAKLLNKYKPFTIAAVPTAVTPDSELAAMRDRGEYVELNEREMLEEEIMLLRALEVDDDCFFFGSHPYNTIPVSANFSERDKMIAYLENNMRKLPPSFLESTRERGQL